MRAKNRLLVLLVALALGFASLGQLSAPEPLPTAVSAGRIRVRGIQGMGGSSGGAVKISVAKGPAAGSRPVVASVPPGIQLASSDAGAQGMVVAGVMGRLVNESQYEPSSVIELDDSSPAEYLLEAYCAEFEKDNPSPSTGFTFNGTDPVLACILRGAHANSLSVPATQAAVWMYTDNITYEHMVQKFPVDSSDWAKAGRVFASCQNRN